MPQPDFPDRLISATTLRQILGGKSNNLLSERGLLLLIRAGTIPAPLMLGRYRRWRWSAIDSAIRKLEKGQLGDK